MSATSRPVDFLQEARINMQVWATAIGRDDEDRWTQAAIAHAAIAQAEELRRIATHLGNIHQALLTPDANREPTTIADQASRIADALESANLRAA